MDGTFTPSASVTKIGSILVIFAVALLAIYVANNYNLIGSWTAKKAAA